MESKMRPAARAAIPAEIQELSCQIEPGRSIWRHRMPMPEPLWTSGGHLARQYGVARVARLLRLDYYSLKERLSTSGTAAGQCPRISNRLELPRRTATVPEWNALLNSNTREAPECGSI
jgi:hypothetical protein